MGRIRIASRLVLIIVGAIVVVQVLMAAVFIVEYRRNADQLSEPPLLAQIAALAQAIERAPGQDRDLILRAVSGSRFMAEIRPQPPTDIVRSDLLADREQRLRVLIGLPDDRLVALSLVTSPQRGGQKVARLRDLVGARVRAIVGLADGSALEVEAAGPMAWRVFGVPAGLLASIFGFVVALIAIVVVRRETKPLSELTAAVSRFGTAAEPQPLTERGAPDIRMLIRAVNAMQDRIAELVRNRTIVLGAISHDLRTYVTRLRLRLELLPDSDQRRKAETDLTDMQALMDDALAFARASLAGAPPEPVNLTAIVHGECDMLRALGRPVTLRDAASPLMVHGTAAGLARVTANLVNNAVAYGGSAEVSLHEGVQTVALWVEDRGPGIPVAERERVFEPFHRLEASRNRDKGGAGLGLTIVRQIVESLGGSVIIGDRPGDGSRVIVTLPRSSP